MSGDRRRGGFLTNAGMEAPEPGIKLAPFAHTEEALYVNRPESVENVTSFRAWADAAYSASNVASNNRYSNPEKLHSDLQLLGTIKSCWNSATDRTLPLYRYLGTESGAFYMTPASVYVPEYDPTTRPWYRRAAFNPSFIALSAPYRDAATNKNVVTISKFIQGNNGRPFGELF